MRSLKRTDELTFIDPVDPIPVALVFVDRALSESFLPRRCKPCSVEAEIDQAIPRILIKDGIKIQ